ncbi:MAG: glycosyltransferase family 4 protein [Syntrophorhabdaceae bacterium]|nr:glycosyltransferase family 4 protein [Syntrophorhabdaceae bacterium]
MKIGLAIYNFDPKKGGAERYVYDLSCMLVKKGHEVFVICGNGIWVNGVKIIKIDTIKYPRWLRTLAFALHHKKIIKTLECDIVLGFGNTLELDVYQSHGGVHKVWMEREIESYDNPVERHIKAFFLKSSIHQRIQKWISEYPIKHKRYNRVVAISHMVKDHMMANYGISEDKIEVIYNGVDTQRFKPNERKNDNKRTRILFSAGNFRLKGLSPLINALELISKKRKDFSLIVMGRGRKDRYMRLIEEKGLKDHVVFTGETSSPEDVYRESHISAHPTFYDACSLTTMEAMASGLPVITTRWNGASGLISEKEGFVIDEPRNIKGLFKAIYELMDKDKRDEMGQNSRLKIESYTMEKNATEMERVFFEVRDGIYTY